LSIPALGVGEDVDLDLAHPAVELPSERQVVIIQPFRHPRLGGTDLRHHRRRYPCLEAVVRADHLNVVHRPLCRRAGRNQCGGGK
jgi:hypothetical protein